MITVNQNGEIYEVSFPYDPFVVDMVKQVPGRRWVSSAKMWTVPRDKLGFLMAQFKGTVYESSIKVISDEHINENATLDTTTVIPNIDISNIPFYVKEGSEPYQHQIDFMKYAIYRQLKGNMNGFVLADDQGCISGDAIIHCCIDQKYYNMTLRDFYQMYISDDSNKYKRYKVQFFQEDKQVFLYNYINKVISSGIKTVVCVSLVGNYKLKCTQDHEILTKHGYVRADELTSNDYVCTLDSWRQVVGIDLISEEDTYDIQMTGPYHNFVANNIVEKVWNL